MTFAVGLPTAVTAPQQIRKRYRGGKIHDKRQLDEADLVGNIPDEVNAEGDLGFQGLQNEFVNIHLPHKKQSGKELSEAQKQENKAFSSQRVVCEHALCMHKAL